MFVDTAKVQVRAGNGGNGIVSFRHEKYIEKGGPDGGDGGNGGNVIFRSTSNQDTLARFRVTKLLKAESGAAGSKRNKRGSNGQDLIIDVPTGTVISNEQGSVIADLIGNNQTAVIARGGRGGFGNAHFISSTRQAPRIAEKGEKGEEAILNLELKVIADVGLVGLPNAGKSTFLASVSNAKPKIANYPFTTLSPNLGFVDLGPAGNLLLADIPGLIEGAASGKGLGDEFLRHVERSMVLLHIIDIYHEDVVKAYQTVQAELAAYKVDLSKRPQVIALNKTEGLSQDILDDQITKLKQIAGNTTLIVAVSAHTKAGVDELLITLKKLADDQKQIAGQSQNISDLPEDNIPTITLKDREEDWKITENSGKLIVEGPKIERFAMRTDFSDQYALDRLKHIMKKMGITNELKRRSTTPDQAVMIGQYGPINITNTQQ